MVQGGKFKHGFFAGAFALMAGSGMEASKWGIFQTTAGGTVTAAMVGGTASALGGGKFANGAVTGAYTMLFNHMQEHVKQKKASKIGSEFYYESLDGMVFNDGTVMSRNDFALTFEDSYTANATYKGFVDGKHQINFSIEDYEVTKANIRALTIHEAFGHGVMGYSSKFNSHYKAYFATIDSKYWGGTTFSFKQHTVDLMWRYYYKEVGYQRMPQPYQSMYDKYIKK